VAETERRREGRSRQKTRRKGAKERNEKTKKKRKMEVRKIAKEWEILDKEEEEAKKLVLEKFHKWIHIFSKKANEQVPIRKLCDYTIDMKEGFVLRKGKVYLLLREEREEVHKFIAEQLRKGYIRPLKLPQTAPVFFVGKKDGKK